MRQTIARRSLLAGAAATLAAPAIVRAQGSAVKIGLITTLSGPGGISGRIFAMRFSWRWRMTALAA